jgi:hypothetical protein
MLKTHFEQVRRREPLRMCKQNAMRCYRKVQIILYAFVISSLDASELLTLSTLSPGKIPVHPLDIRLNWPQSWRDKMNSLCAGGSSVVFASYSVAMFTETPSLH